MKANVQTHPAPNSERYSGILAHPTSFPSYYGVGDLGDTAYRFIDYLVSAGQTLWQVLPLGPTGFGDSPYQSFSAFAGQPLLISPEKMRDEGLLSQEDLDAYPNLPTKYVDYGAVIQQKNILFAKAYEAFLNISKSSKLYKRYETFCEKEAFWLDNYCLFMAIKDSQEGKLG